MCRFLIYCIINFIVYKSNAQTTWFKLLPGWQAQRSIILNDTIHTFCNDDYSFYDFFFSKSKIDINGNLIKTDTLIYKKIIRDSLATSIIVNKWINPIKLNDSLYIPITVKEKNQFEYKYKNYFFNLIDLLKNHFNPNFDTSQYVIRFSQIFNGISYYVIEENIKYSDNSTASSYYLFKIENSRNSKIYKITNNQWSINNHVYNFQYLMEDNQNHANLFIEVFDGWDYRDVPTSFERIIQKIDTSGNVLWSTIPTGNQDTISNNTFLMTQLPNGNLLCSWVDYYFRPWKNREYPHRAATPNNYATAWFAEIDYATGNRLWVKNSRQYLTWKMHSNGSGYTGSHLMEAIKFDDGVVWCGYRTSGRYPLSNIIKPYLFKTDFKGNPIWYREYNVTPDDTSYFGFKAYSFIKTPDNGFLLTGEYTREWGISGDTINPIQSIQKAALLKLDSNGCFEPGCNAKDHVINIKAPNKICQIFPNPTTDFIYIDFPIGVENWETQIYDLNGKVVFKSKNILKKIPILDLANGVYIIHLFNTTLNHHETHQIIINH